jgi:hypothetical protein
MGVVLMLRDKVNFNYEFSEIVKKNPEISPKETEGRPKEDRRQYNTSQLTKS